MGNSKQKKQANNKKQTKKSLPGQTLEIKIVYKPEKEKPNQQREKDAGNKTVGKEKFPHFRHYKKSNHPALVVGEQVIDDKEEWKYRKVSHSERDGRHLNEKVYPNPNPKDKRPMYIGKRVRHDEKKNFSSWKYPWKYKQKKK